MGLVDPGDEAQLRDRSPLTLTATRFAVAVVLLFLFTLGQHQPRLRALPPAAGLGVLGIGVGHIAQAFGFADTATSVGTFISATIPVFIVDSPRTVSSSGRKIP